MNNDNNGNFIINVNSSGNLIAQTINFNAPVTFDGKTDFSSVSNPQTQDDQPTQEVVVPEVLANSEAWQKLKNAGLVDEYGQPVGLSGAERGLVARAVCERLKIAEVWQMFGQLWHEKPETLRSYFNKAYEQKKSLEFQERLKNILD
jgi:hypothetical protein